MFYVLATSVDGTDGHRACIKAKQKGKHCVVAKSDDGGYTDTCVVIVIPERISVTGLTLNHASKTLHKGETLQLTPVFTPANPTNPNVYWYMNNDSVVTLNNGLVTAIQEGTVTITCVSEDGNYEATCGVTVTNEEPPVFEPITVRLKASSATGWSIVNLYYWGDGIIGPAWPGIATSKDLEGWYSHTFDASVTSVNIIWNDGSNQTVDITDVTESTCYSLNSTSGATITVTIADCGTQDVQHPIVDTLYKKVLHNGQIFILRGEKVYTVTGQEVQ